MAKRAGKLAGRMRDIAPFHVMALLARARELEAQGRAIIHMEIGEPDFATPLPVCEAAARVLQQGELFYTQSTGLPELKRALAGFYEARHGVKLPPERIVITTGASAALMLACATLVDPGDEVLIADPGYPCNRHFVRLMEGSPLPVAVGAATDYQLTTSLLDLNWTDRTIGALVASPSNPTGTLSSTEKLAAMADVCRARGGTLIVDEIYHGLIYEGEYTTALALSDEVFVINSFSKYFNMTGWRLGWLVVPEQYIPEVDKLAQNIYLAPPTLAQVAARAAFRPETIPLPQQRRS